MAQIGEFSGGIFPKTTADGHHIPRATGSKISTLRGRDQVPMPFKDGPTPFWGERRLRTHLRELVCCDQRGVRTGAVATLTFGGTKVIRGTTSVRPGSIASPGASWLSCATTQVGTEN